MTANVITYRDRSAAREVGKALGYSQEQADKLSKTVSTWNFGEIREKIESLPEELAKSGFDPEDLRVQHFMRLYLQIQNLPLPLDILSHLAPMRYAVDLLRDAFYGSSSEVVVSSATTNLAIIGALFVVFMVVGTFLFVRAERNR